LLSGTEVVYESAQLRKPGKKAQVLSLLSPFSSLEVSTRTHGI
jgi:hypothetical protein